MKNEDSPIEDYVAEYLTKHGQEEVPSLEKFLTTLPQEHREECRERISTALKTRSVLADLRGSTRQTATEAPKLPGFRIERQLGQGGLGTVFAAQDETLERRVALKVLRRGTEESLRNRILREARRAARLHDHPEDHSAIACPMACSEGGNARSFASTSVGSW